MSRNRLAETASPYLRQHADNPVHWWPWTDAAFEEARQRNVPIHLSIGYAACHWCHVMAGESFSDPQIAAYLNEHFVNIKVDREERPDVDQVYMKALQALGEQGGWPLTMFLGPGGEPFWGGTYFPPEPRWGRPGFPQLLEGISAAWQSGEKRIADNMTALTDHLDKHPDRGTSLPERDVLDQAVGNVLSIWDHEKGGIRGAPKFPMSPLLDLLWRSGLRTGDATARNAVLTTLRKMSSGGIYDHLSGGYARYSVDGDWLVPHFEKMLSDNGQILSLLVRAWQASGEPLFRQRAEETASWLIADMQLPGGGFAASLDADTDHEEGLTYVWQKAEIDEILGPDSKRFCDYYDVQAGGNWEGKVILNRLKCDPETMFDPAIDKEIAGLRSRLLAVRRLRAQPPRDEKVLADWNGLAITALADAAVAFDNPQYLRASESAFQFVCGSMIAAGRLSHSWCDGSLTSGGLATDYAQMTRAALTLHAASGDPEYLAHAETWFSAFRNDYSDSGWVFLSPSDTDLIVRPTGTQDDATPSAAGVSVQNAMHLLLLTGKSDYLDNAEEILTAQAGQIGRDIVGSASLLAGLDSYFRPRLAYVAGMAHPAGGNFRTAALAEADPAMLVLSDRNDTADRPKMLPEAADPDETQFFLCEAMTCRAPVTTERDVKDLLTGTRRGNDP